MRIFTLFIKKIHWKIIFYHLLPIDMMSLLKIEVFNIFKRPRTYIAFAVIALIIILIQIALKFGGKEYVGLMFSGLNDSFEEIPSEIVLNGYLVCFII